MRWLILFLVLLMSNWALCWEGSDVVRGISLVFHWPFSRGLLKNTHKLMVKISTVYGFTHYYSKLLRSCSFGSFSDVM